MSKDNFGTPKKFAKQFSPNKIGISNSLLQRSLVPPVLQEVGKLAAGVAAVATGTGSATGRFKFLNIIF